MIRAVVLALFIATVAVGQSDQVPASEYRVAGTVVDLQTGTPLARTRVSLAHSGTTSVQGTFITGADGHFSFEHVLAGKYLLDAARQGYPRQGYEQHEQYVTGVVVGSGLDTEHLRFRMRAQAVVSGHVTDEFGDPVQNASVLIFYEGSIGLGKVTRLVKTLSTDDQGEYYLGDMPPGKYYVAVNASPWYRTPSQPELDVAYPFTFFGTLTDSGRPTAIRLRVGERRSLDFRMHAVPTIHVRFRRSETPGGDGPASYRILIPAFYGPDVEAPQSYVGPAGDVGLAPGRYVIEMLTRAGTVARAEFALSGNAEIGPEQILAKGSTASITGAITFDGDFPHGMHAVLELREVKSGSSFEAPIGADGKFSLKEGLLPGSYTVSLRSASGFFVWGVAAIGAQTAGTVVEIARSQPVQLSVVATRATTQVAGTVTLQGKDASGCMVVLVPENTSNLALYRRDQSDSDGSFSLRSVLPGNYTVIALRDWEVDWANPDVLHRFLSSGVSLHVSGNEVAGVRVQAE